MYRQYVGKQLRLLVWL